MMNNLTLRVTYTAKPGMREAFIQAIEKSGLLDKIQQEEGCLGYDYYCSAANKEEILLIEKWESEEHQKVHMTQPHMKMFRFVKDCYIRWETISHLI